MLVQNTDKKLMLLKVVCISFMVLMKTKYTDKDYMTYTSSFVTCESQYVHT